MRLRHILFGAAAVAALVASPASAASLLNIRATGVVSGYDYAGVLGAPGAIYTNSSFLLTSQFDLTKGNRFISAQYDYVNGYSPAQPGKGTSQTGGNTAAWGNYFSILSVYHDASGSGPYSQLFANFQNGSSNIDLFVSVQRADLTLNSLNAVPHGNLCAGAISCQLLVRHPGNSSAFITDLTSLTVSAAVPEPSAWALMIAGFATAGLSMRRRRRVIA